MSIAGRGAKVLADGKIWICKWTIVKWENVIKMFCTWLLDRTNMYIYIYMCIYIHIYRHYKIYKFKYIHIYMHYLCIYIYIQLCQISRRNTSPWDMDYSWCKPLLSPLTEHASRLTYNNNLNAAGCGWKRQGVFLDAENQEMVKIAEFGQPPATSVIATRFWCDSIFI